MDQETVLASQTWSLKERAFSGIGVTLSIDIDLGLVLTIASDLRVTETQPYNAKAMHSCYEPGNMYVHNVSGGVSQRRTVEALVAFTKKHGLRSSKKVPLQVA